MSSVQWHNELRFGASIIPILFARLLSGRIQDFKLPANVYKMNKKLLLSAKDKEAKHSKALVAIHDL